jgi:hypothetical protein
VTIAVRNSMVQLSAVGLTLIKSLEAMTLDFTL